MFGLVALITELILVLQKPAFWIVLVFVVILQTIRARQEARVLEDAFGDTVSRISPQNVVLGSARALPRTRRRRNISAMKKLPVDSSPALFCAVFLSGRRSTEDSAHAGSGGQQCGRRA